MRQGRKMIRRWARRALAGLVAGSLCLINPGMVRAVETQEFNFDPVLVTALRRESKELTTPAAVEVLTQEKIKQTGAANVLEALKFTTGLTIDTYGARGSLQSGMTGGVSIRGMGKELGALVMLNGVPLNLNGKYELQNIPAENIERIEIVKGAASTLYGSAALGGVINIITKKHVDNSVSTEVGSFGTNRETLIFGEGPVSLAVLREYTGNMGHMQADKPGYVSGSKTYAPNYTNFDWEAKQTYDFSWNITKTITFNYHHIDDVYQLSKYVASTGKIGTKTWTQGDYLGNMWQQDANDIASLQVKTGTWVHKFYYNGLVRNYANQNPGGSLASNGSALTASQANQYMQTYGLDSQSNWKTGYGDYTVGFSWQKDTYRNDSISSPSQSISLKQRDLLSVFGQIDHPVTSTTNVILGVRQDVVLQQNGADNLSNFSPQMQILHRINQEQSVYFNVGESFRAPNWSAMYLSSAVGMGNPTLEPDRGWNYEIGWKKIGKADSLKFAVYKLDFPSFHKWVYNSVNQIYVAQNTEFRNLGMELEYNRTLKNGWGYTLGAMFGNPESRVQGADWAQSEAKLQLNAGVNYKKKKWTGSLVATYIGLRQLCTVTGLTDQVVPPSLQANLTLAYDVSKYTQLSMRIDNLFNRIDYTTDGGYITPERAFYLKLTRNF